MKRQTRAYDGMAESTCPKTVCTASRMPGGAATAGHTMWVPKWRHPVGKEALRAAFRAGNSNHVALA